MTEDEAKKYLGKYCRIYTGKENRTGVVTKVELGWLSVDYSYGILVKDIERIEVVRLVKAGRYYYPECSDCRR